MLRVQHNQTVAGAILIDDVDDGLPNKEVHRLGSTGDPDAYARDGYANKPKQPCYVPRTQASLGFPLIKGYIDLNQTPRVVLSAGKGKISKLRASGLVTVLDVDPALVKAPVLKYAVLTGGNLTLTGTTLTSVAPDITAVVITGAGAVTLGSDVITAGGGTVGAASIVIPVALIPGVVVTTSFVKVIANGKSSTVATVLAAVPPSPTLTTAALSGGNLALTGTGFTPPLLVDITGTGAVSLTSTQITAGTGAISATAISIPAALVPGIAATSSSVKVTTNIGATSVVPVT